MNERSAAPRLVTPPVESTSEKMGTASGVVPTCTDASIRPGALVNGKYLVGPVLGEGGVGIVYEAQNLELDEKVALKCLRPQMLVDTAMVARFAREAKAAASIKSEYVATVYDVGTMSDGAPYMVMEFLDGKDLGAVIHERGVLTSRAATEYALQVCEALAVAHAKGIVHRDIKPENLMLTERAGGMRIVKVLDFGISKTALTGSIFGSDLPTVKTVNLMGTPLYMSPEQMRCTDHVDARSDIWSLGMVVYELLTGTTAFAATTIPELCVAILEAAPQPIEGYRKDLPPGLVDVIHRCLEKDPARRYQNVAELALALMAFGPKRARLNVERSMAVLQGAGMLDDRMRVLSTMPPSGVDGGHADSMPVVPHAPRLPSVPNVNVTEAPAPLRASSTFSELDEPPRPRTRRKAAILGVLIGSAALVGFVVTRSTSRPTAEAGKTVTTASSIVVPAATALGAPVASEATSLSLSPPSSLSSPSAASSARAALRPRPAASVAMGLSPTKPPPRGNAAPIVISTTTPSTPVAAKPADEPDLGY